MRNQQGRLEIRLGWLGGAIDGEGCIHLSRRNDRKTLSYRPRLVIVNTDMVFCKEVIDIFKLCTFAYHVSTRKAGCKKPYLEMEIQGLRRLNKALPVLIPYLVSKKERAIYLHNYIKYRLSLENKAPIGEKDYAVYLRMRQFNGALSLEPSETIRTTHLSKCEDIVRSA
jgi:hypothetical protein